MVAIWKEQKGSLRKDTVHTVMTRMFLVVMLAEVVLELALSVVVRKIVGFAEKARRSNNVI